MSDSPYLNHTGRLTPVLTAIKERLEKRGESKHSPLHDLEKEYNEIAYFCMEDYEKSRSLVTLMGLLVILDALQYRLTPNQKQRIFTLTTSLSLSGTLLLCGVHPESYSLVHERQYQVRLIKALIPRWFTKTFLRRLDI